MYRIYTKKKKTKEIFNVNMSREDIERYNIDIWVDHKDLNKEDYIVVYRMEPFIAPIYDGETIREATKEEKIALGYPYELEDGEKVEDGKLVTVPIPNGLYRAVWDREMEEWKEGATSEEILIERKSILLQAKAIKQEIKDLEEIAEWGLDEDLDSVDTIKMLQEKFDDLIEKAKGLTQTYKKLKKQENQAI